MTTVKMINDDNLDANYCNIKGNDSPEKIIIIKCEFLK